MRSIKIIQNLSGKVVLLRSDLNVENVQESFKLSKALPTISFLKKKGAITIITAHRGRPKGWDNKASLRPLLGYLIKRLGKITFIPSHEKQAIERALASAKPGSLFLLENVRFHPGEDKSDLQWGKLLASVSDLYVNDAFPSHHPGTTVSVLPKLLPSYIGLQMEAEIQALSAVMKRPKKPLVLVLAGGKAADKFAVIEYLYPKASMFLIGGILANTFFKAMGADIDSSIIDTHIVSGVRRFLNDKKIVLPMDWISDHTGKILDLGPLSAKEYAGIIARAGTVIWNGPMGFFEDPRFKPGSVAIAKAIAKSKAFSVVGGGETTSLILDLRLQKKIGFLSTGGGAMLAFLAGKPHAGLEAMGYHR